ncbi:MAG: Ketose-bisphosphate aldolase, class-II [Parcubacteria group bacterium GW2011_GWA2_47_21]|nr:MAG: Ketose-bisphosphate aldolase, class-II [Parcubacteria group bacterium GW2011_GWA2_47_21]
MKSLRECIEKARADRTAIGHFNASNIETISAIFRAAKKQNTPVIIGFSEGERDFFGVRQAVAVVKSIRDEFDFPIFSNADHTYSFERVKEAIDAGFDAVIFDGTELLFEENIRVARKCVRYARASSRDVLVEGELGFIGKSSKVLDSLPVGVKIGEEFLTKPEEAERFVKETGVDLLAPAVGNIHGMLASGLEPALNIERVKAVRAAAGASLVLHGASGNTASDIQGAIKAGAAIVHINTELRVAYRKALMLSLQENPDEVAPYKYLKPAMQAVERTVEAKLKIIS